MRKPWRTSLAILGLLPACTLVTGSLDDYSSGSTAADAGGDRAVGPNDAAGAGDGAVDTDAADALATLSYRDTVLADAPLVYFRLGEGPASPVIRDEVSGLTASIAGLVTRGEPGGIAGDPDTAMTFDMQATVSVPGSSMDFPDRAPFSVECWIKPSLVDGDYRRIVTNEGSDGAGRQGWLLWVVDRPNGNDGIGFERYTNGNGAGVVSRTIPPPDRWTHAVGTYDGSFLNLYVDGVLIDAVPSTKPLVGQAAVRLGAGVASGLVGGLDEVAIYDHALGIDRVVAHYARGRSDR